MTRVEETHAALMEAVEIYREKIKRKPKIYIKELKLSEMKDGKDNKPKNKG